MQTVLDLKEINCANCAILFAMPDDYIKRRRTDGRMFYCPNGHTQYYPNRESELEKLKKENQSLKNRLTWADQSTERMNKKLHEVKQDRANIKRSLTNTQKRIANGICPCCHRTFVNVSKHMTSKHPDFKKAVA